MAVYRLFRDEFSSWYLEMVKPPYQKPVDGATYAATLGSFDSLLRLLHPFMPFITEELWQHLQERPEGESIMLAAMPRAEAYDSEVIARVDTVKEIVNGIRAVRASKNIPNKDQLTLLVVGSEKVPYPELIIKMGNLSAIENIAEKDPAAAQFMVGTREFCVPLADNIDIEAELAKMRKELDYERGFLASVERKLSNERFVNNAPAAVVDNERRKKADAESKIAALEQSIAALSK